MKKFWILLLVCSLTLCLCGCVEPSDEADLTELPELTLPQQTAPQQTDAAGNQSDDPEPSFAATSPQDMPDPPEADYTLPPGEGGVIDPDKVHNN